MKVARYTILYMTTNRFIFIVGLLVFLVPMAGFPQGWEEGFLILAGLLLMLLTSLNIWQRSIVNRLKFHSKQLKITTHDTQASTETPSQE